MNAMDDQVDERQAWLRAFSQGFRPNCAAEALAGTAAGYLAGTLQVVQLKTSGSELHLDIDSVSDSWATVILQREATAMVRKAGDVLELSKDQLAVFPNDDPFTVALSPMAWQTWLILPAAALRRALAHTEATRPIALHAPVQAQMLVALADLGQALDVSPNGRAGLQHIANAIAELVAAAVTTGLPMVARPNSNLANFHLERIKRFILNNLQDPELSVRMVSDRLKISLAHVHRVFLNERQTCGEWILDQRLLGCRAALERSGKRRSSVSQIAFSFGFSNSSHFSRVFRAKFGQSPTACQKGLDACTDRSRLA